MFHKITSKYDDPHIKSLKSTIPMPLESLTLPRKKEQFILTIHNVDEVIRSLDDPVTQKIGIYI